MKLNLKYSFLYTININNKLFIELLDENYMTIYLDILYIYNNDLLNYGVKYMGNLCEDETSLIRDYFINKDILELCNTYHIKKNSIYEKIKKILSKLINYINYKISYLMYNDNKNNPNIPIEILYLSKITYNTLKRRGINTIEDLISLSIEDLIYNGLIGYANISSIIDEVHKLGYKFKNEVEVNYNNIRRYIRKK